MEELNVNMEELVQAKRDIYCEDKKDIEYAGVFTKQQSTCGGKRVRHEDMFNLHLHIITI